MTRDTTNYNTSISAQAPSAQRKTRTIGSPLNKTQYAEFARSAINQAYADANFCNLTPKQAAALLNPTGDAGKSLMYEMPIKNGGWCDRHLHTFKPRTPRNEDIKYETLVKGSQLWRAHHPAAITPNSHKLFICEGAKKAVATAQHFGGVTYYYDSLGHALGLLSELTALASQYDEVYWCPDNDESQDARQKAEAICQAIVRGNQNAKVASFYGKGIDDALCNGIDAVRWLDAKSWRAVAPSCKGWDFVENRRYFSEFRILSGVRLYAIKGEKGTGKTYQLERFAKAAIAEGRTVIVCVHRISLGRDLVRRLGIPYIEDADYKGVGSVALCVNSIEKVLINESLAGATLIIDESDQVLNDLFESDTMRKNRTKIVAHVQALGMTIANTFGGSIVVSSADISDRHIADIQDFFSINAGATYKIWNQFVPEKGDCFLSFGVGLTPDSKKFKPYDGVLFLRDLAKAGKRILCHLSAQDAASKFSSQVLEEFLKITNPDARILRIDSETNKDPNHPAFNAARNIKALCLSHDVILATPTIGTGVDISFPNEAENPVFDAVIVFANGVTNDSDAARQAAGRYRNFKCPLYIFAVPSFQIKPGSLADKIFNMSQFEAFEAAHQWARNEFDPDFWQQNPYNADAILNLSKTQLIQRNNARLKESQDFGNILANKLRKLDNYTLKAYECPYSFDDYQAVDNALKAISEQLGHDQIDAIATAPELSEDAYKSLLEKTTQTADEIAQIKAFQIRKSYGLEPTQQVQTLIENGTLATLKNNFFLTDGYEFGQKLAAQSNYFRTKDGRKDLAKDFIEDNNKALQARALLKINFIERCRKGVTTQEALQILRDLIDADLANYSLFNLPKNSDLDEKTRTDALSKIAKNFGFRFAKKSKKVQGKSVSVRVLEDFDVADERDGQSIKAKVFKHWFERYSTKIAAWDTLQTDIKLVQAGKMLDSIESSMLFGSNPNDSRFKYTQLSTRAKTLTSPGNPPKWQWAHKSPKEFKAWLKSAPSLAVDIETYSSDPTDKMGGLNHETGSIALVQFADNDHIWMTTPDDLKTQFRRDFRLMMARRTQRKVGHNFTFDLRFLAHQGLVGEIRNVADTMLGSRCLCGDLGAAQLAKHSLEMACLNFLGIRISKDEQKSDWSGTLTESQLNYAALDPWYTFQLDKRLQELCAKPSLIGLPMPEMMALKHWETRNATLPAFISMGLTGYVINENKTIIEEQRKAKLIELKAEWEALCPDIKPTQTRKLLEYVNRKYGLKLASLNKQNVVGDARVQELELRQTIGAIEKELDICAKVVAVGQRHSPVITACSGTGRTSSGATKVNKKFFNMQSLPARVNPAIPESFGFLPLKAMFNTDCVIDLPASHGRISAELAQDDYAIAAYTDDSVDMHCDTAAIIGQIALAPDDAVRFVSGYIKEQNKNPKTADGRIAKGLRDTAKNTYYGWLNGAGASRIKDQIQNNLGIEVSRDKCQIALDGMQKNFSKTVEYAKSILSQLEDPAHQFVINGKVVAYMEFAGVYLCWSLGVVGTDIKIPATKAFASIWSCTESLLMNKAITNIHETFEANPQWGARLQNFIHDEINIEYKDIEAAKYAYESVKKYFAEICPLTISGFDKFEKCVFKKNEKPITNWADK